LGKIFSKLSVPFGVHVIWDAESTLCLATATGADFAWEVYSGVYASDYGLWNTDAAHYAALLREWGNPGKIRRLCEIIPEAAVSIDGRSLGNRMLSMDKTWTPYGFCVAGPQPGIAPPLAWLSEIPETKAKLFISTGIRKENVLAYLEVSDGVIVGSAFKQEGQLFNIVDEARVREMVSLIRTKSRA
jgi:predicted TIM-barrel enzyme